MKVFISWSGVRSKKVAMVFQDWLPSVIQSIEPFVSSEDIDKGSRWHTDIAQELKASNFGIICVTQDNLTAPWLNFEAGALSKMIENNYVAPFLLDVKPSDLKDSPISQFQATSFSSEDIKRLMETLNVAANNCLEVTRLYATFDKWYPSLETSLNELRAEPIDEASESLTNVHPDLLEELLEMSRNTQRLLGNTDVKLNTSIEQLLKKVDEAALQNNRLVEMDYRRYSRKMRPMLIEELIHLNRDNRGYKNVQPYTILIALSIFRDDFPWLYDAGSDFVKVVQSNVSNSQKNTALKRFRDILEFTCEHPIMREMFRSNKDSIIMSHELPMMITEMAESYLELNNRDIIDK